MHLYLFDFRFTRIKSSQADSPGVLLPILLQNGVPEVKELPALLLGPEVARVQQETSPWFCFGQLRGILHKRGSLLLVLSKGLETLCLEL
jgi:hypothetical protein